MKLYVLAVSVWDADDYINQRNTNPKCCDLYLFEKEQQAAEKAKKIYCDSDIYNDATVYEGSISESEILELSGCEEISEFKKMLAEPYSTALSEKNWGEDEKAAVAQAIVDDSENYYPVDAANNDFDKSLEGSILVFWSWQKYIGYARECIEVRYANSDETEAILTKEDKTFVGQCDVLLTAEDVKKSKNLYLDVLDELQKDTWKWTNPNYAESQAEQFE